MIQANLILPKKDNNGKCVLKHINSLRLECAKKFGGLTISNCTGDWYNKGKLYSDDNIKIEVSIENDLLYRVIRALSLRLVNNNLSSKEIFLLIAKKYGLLTGQLAIHIVVNGEAKIINL
jgi:hypothetical protein